jgi:hypothetical protein
MNFIQNNALNSKSILTLDDSLFLACQHLNSRTNLRECEDQSWFKVRVLPMFRFDLCKTISYAPSGTNTPG